MAITANMKTDQLTSRLVSKVRGVVHDSFITFDVGFTVSKSDSSLTDSSFAIWTFGTVTHIAICTVIIQSRKSAVRTLWPLNVAGKSKKFNNSITFIKHI